MLVKYFWSDDDYFKLTRDVDKVVNVIFLMTRRKNVEFPNIEEMMVSQVEVQPEIKDKHETAVKFAFLGGGQAGGKLCEKFYKQGYQRILVVNTTEQDFMGLSFPHKLLIGGGICGAGKNPEVGKAAAEYSREDILRQCKKSFGTDVEHIMVCVSSGGGTGSGSCGVLVDVAGDYLESLGKPRKVGVIVALPKKSEGASVAANSKILLTKLNELADAKTISTLIVCDNEKILKMYPGVSVGNFYEVANQTISSLFNVFNELSAKNSAYSTLDRADYKTILESGCLVMGMTILPDPTNDTSIAAAVEKNVKAGLFADAIIKGATHAGAILVATQAMLNQIPQSSLDMAFQTLTRAMGGDNILLHSGIYEGPESLGTKAVIYTMIGNVKFQST